MTQASARSAAPLSALVVVPRSAPRSAAVTGLRSAHWSVGPWVPSPEQPPRPLHRHHRAPTTDTSIRRLHCLPRRRPHHRRSITTRTERKLSLSHDAPKALTIASLRALAASFQPDTPLLVPQTDGEDYEPLVMAWAVHVGADFTAATHTASGARLAYVLLTASKWEREREKRAAT